MTIHGKAAVITGASGSVGRATALALAKEGCSVLVNFCHSPGEAEKTAAAVRALGVRAVCFQAAVESDAACRAMMDTAFREFSRLDILVNTAGSTRFIPLSNLEAVTDADWERTFGVNLKGAFQCARAARAHMEASGGGEIVNVASIAGIIGTGSSIPYCASKSALINLTIALARALAPKIRVNAVAPGFIEGEWLRRGLGEAYEATKREKEAHALLGRVCQPEDVAAAILSLITGSDMVTGQTLVCDGGQTIGPPLARKSK